MTAARRLDFAEPTRSDPISAPFKPESSAGADPGDLDRRVRARLESDLGEEAQLELARLLRVRAQLRSATAEAWRVRRVELAIEALIQGSPKLEFARTVRSRADLELLAQNGPVNRVFVRLLNANPGAIGALGVFLTMLGGFTLVALNPAEMIAGHFSRFTKLTDPSIPLVAFAAFLGGAVSILSRLSNLSGRAEFDPLAVFLNGLLKPYLGMLFGIFVYAFVRSGLGEFGFAWTPSEHLWWTIGFVAGFSERLPKDIVARGESLLAGR